MVFDLGARRWAFAKRHADFGGRLAHLVVERISSGIIVDGGGMKFGEPGTYEIGLWLLLIGSGIPLILMLLSIYYSYHYKNSELLINRD